VKHVAAAQLREAIGFAELIDPVARAFVMTARGKAANQTFTLHPLGDPSRADVMIKAGVVTGEPVFVVKVAPWYADLGAAGKPQGGLFMIFDATTGQPLVAIEDEHYISDIRTAAAGALAARYLVPSHVVTAGVVGSGRQAELQVLALHQERPFERLLVWSRRTAGAEALVGRLAPRLPRVAIEIVSDVETLVRRTDALVTTTSTTEPLIRADWLRAGQHLTAIGADDAGKCELAPECLLRATVVAVDDRAAALAAGEVHCAIAAGHDLGNHMVEIGAIIDGSAPGRTSDQDITVATFSGIGAQDVLAASAVVAALDRPIVGG
jgi:ornithine cyclodeaminase